MNQHTGTPHRIRIAMALRLGHFTGAELSRMLSISYWTAIRHLRALRKSRVVTFTARAGIIQLQDRVWELRA